MGKTPCRVKIPRDSKLIRRHRVKFTFCLPDGHQQSRVVNVRKVKSPNPVAKVVAAPFLLVGMGLLAISGVSDPDAEECDGKLALLGLGAAGVGAGTYKLLGGDADSLEDYPVRVDFTKLPNAGDPPTPPSPPPERSGRENTEGQPGP
jgi:hypothetical protein